MTINGVNTHQPVSGGGAAAPVQEKPDVKDGIHKGGGESLVDKFTALSPWKQAGIGVGAALLGVGAYLGLKNHSVGKMLIPAAAGALLLAACSNTEVSDKIGTFPSGQAGLNQARAAAGDEINHGNLVIARNDDTGNTELYTVEKNREYDQTNQENIKVDRIKLPDNLSLIELVTTGKDILRPSGERFVNAGSVYEKIDTSRLNPEDLGAVEDRLSGIRLGSDSDDNIVRLGAVVSETAHNTQRDAMTEAASINDGFSTQSLAVVSVGDKFVVMDLDGEIQPNTAVRGEQIDSRDVSIIYGNLELKERSAFHDDPRFNDSNTLGDTGVYGVVGRVGDFHHDEPVGHVIDVYGDSDNRNLTRSILANQNIDQTTFSSQDKAIEGAAREMFDLFGLFGRSIFNVSDKPQSVTIIKAPDGDYHLYESGRRHSNDRENQPLWPESRATGQVVANLEATEISRTRHLGNGHTRTEYWDTLAIRRPGATTQYLPLGYGGGFNSHNDWYDQDDFYRLPPSRYDDRAGSPPSGGSGGYNPGSGSSGAGSPPSGGTGGYNPGSGSSGPGSPPSGGTGGYDPGYNDPYDNPFDEPGYNPGTGSGGFSPGSGAGSGSSGSGSTGSGSGGSGYDDSYDNPFG